MTVLVASNMLSETYGLCGRLVQCIVNHSHKPYTSDSMFEATCSDIDCVVGMQVMEMVKVIIYHSLTSP
jgi:hypothetical protein